MFKSLHPSGSAGDGEPILQGKYEYPTDKPDHFIRCALCGWVKDMDRAQEGDSLLSPGISYNAQVSATVKQPVYNGATGNNFTDKTIEPNVVGGCPFCGTFNSRGNLLDREFGSEVDISNL